jgi:hypothetical protein
MSGARLKEESKAYFRALGQHIREVQKEQGMTQARARPRIRALTADCVRLRISRATRLGADPLQARKDIRSLNGTN